MRLCRWGFATAVVFSALGCASDGPTDVEGPGDSEPTGGTGSPIAGLTAGQHDRVAGRLAVIAVAVAASREGRGFFDNFQSCVRRGVIDYRNSDAGRLVTFSGCDLGDGVVIDGSGELSWATPPSPDREEFCAWTTVQVCSSALSWSGALEISVDAATVSATGFSVEDIALRSSDGTEFRYQTIVTGEFTIGEVQVSLGSRTTPIEDVSLPAAVFPADASDIGTIDNPGGALDALTEADLKRVFYQAGFGLASILFNETIEIQRGDHEHVLDCGLISVTVLPTQLPLLQNTWSSCHFFPGLFVSGDFSLEWQEIDSDVLKLVMVLDGVAVLEGGLPTIELTGMVWTLERVPDSDPDLFHFRLSGELITPTASRTFSIEFVLDD